VEIFQQFSQIAASNKIMVSTKKIFSETLSYFRELATKELEDVTGLKVNPIDVRYRNTL